MIFLDLNMPVMDGWEFCRLTAAGSRLGRIPVAIISATTVDELPERTCYAGYLHKPCDMNELPRCRRRTRARWRAPGARNSMAKLNLRRKAGSIPSVVLEIQMVGTALVSSSRLNHCLDMRALPSVL